jgi:hypothetical protein
MIAHIDARLATLLSLVENVTPPSDSSGGTGAREIR